MKRILAIGLFLLLKTAAEAQVKLYEDQFHGGVTGAGYSSGTSGTSTGFMNVQIHPGSTIRKAYLIVGRLGPAPPMTVNLNSLVLTFDSSNQASPTFNSPLYGGPSAVHAIDITTQINPAVNSYTISNAQAGGGFDFFTDFYLYIAYEHPALALVNTVVFLKTLDYQAIETYSLSLPFPLDTSVAIGFAMSAGYMCNSLGDGEIIHIDTTVLGQIGSNDINSEPSCGGTVGSFWYQNDTLHGLNDDFPDQAMQGTDALSDIRQVVPHNATSLTATFEHVGGASASPDNSMWAWFITYGNSSLLPIAAFFSANHICPGTCTDFTNFSSYANSYLWNFPGAIPSTSTDTNPTGICYNLPGQYPVTLIATNVNGSDTLTLPNYLTVYPFSPPQSIQQNGDTLVSNQGFITYQWYFNSTLIPGATEYFYVASQSGNYNVICTDVNDCEVEAVIFNVVADVDETSGKGVLEVFPNPAGDQFVVRSLLFVEKSVRLTIYDSLGEIVRSDLLQATNSELRTISCNDLSAGLYWLELKGSLMAGMKFIKR